MLDSSKFGHKFTYQFLLLSMFHRYSPHWFLQKHRYHCFGWAYLVGREIFHNRAIASQAQPLTECWCYFWTQAKIVCGVHAHNLSQCWQTILDVLDIHGIRCLACILLQLLVLRFDSLFKSSSLHSNWSLKFTIATITIHRLWNWLA